MTIKRQFDRFLFPQIICEWVSNIDSCVFFLDQSDFSICSKYLVHEKWMSVIMQRLFVSASYLNSYDNICSEGILWRCIIFSIRLMPSIICSVRNNINKACSKRELIYYWNLLVSYVSASRLYSFAFVSSFHSMHLLAPASVCYFLLDWQIYAYRWNELLKIKAQHLRWMMNVSVWSIFLFNETACILVGRCIFKISPFSV